MILMCAATIGGGPGARTIAKPGGGQMRLVTNPRQILGATGIKLFDAKMQTIQNASSSGILQAATDLSQLTQSVSQLVAELFPAVKVQALLKKQGTDYTTVLIEPNGTNLSGLNLNAAQNSILRVAAEAKPLERRTIYFPNVDKQALYLSSEFDEAAGAQFETDKHELEEGTLEGSRLTIDQISIRRAPFKSLIVAPILEYKHTDPIGALLLLGEPGFVNPYMDLTVLRILADLIAKPLKTV